jgi:YD repeat-containing protein
MNARPHAVSTSARLFCIVLSWVLLAPPMLFTPARVVAAPVTKRATPRTITSQAPNQVGQRHGESPLQVQPEASEEDKDAALRAPVALDSLPSNEEKEESSDREPEDSTEGDNTLAPSQGGANHSPHNRRRVTPLFEVSDLPDLKQLRGVQSRVPRAAKPIPSTLRRYRSVYMNSNGNGRSLNGDSGTVTLQRASTDTVGNEIMAAKYSSQPRHVLIAANHSVKQSRFSLPVFKYLEGKSAMSTSDAPDNIAWSYSAPVESEDSIINRTQPQGGESISNLLVKLGSFNSMLVTGMPQTSSPNDAAFVSQTVPTVMVAGQQYTVTVKMQNTGSTTWTAGEGYRLGPQFPQDNPNWGVGRVELPGAVAPNQEVTFTFQVTAPSTPAVYHFQWGMLRENFWWFGETSADTLVIVESNAAFVSQNVPTVMQAGQTYPVSVTMTNTGPVTWTSENLYSLGARNPQDNSIWGANSGRTNLPAPVAPNQTVTFNFNVTAPSTPGSYNFQRQMVKDGLSWFGATTPNVAVNVTADGTFTPTPAGHVLISEFRFRGAGGSADEFVELYNNTNAPITVGTEDGSEGWSLVAFNPASGAISTVFTVPAATIIPARGHFLAVGQAYSLSGYAEADLAYGSNDISDNAGIALFRTATPAGFTTANRLDAVGFTNLANTLFYEGTGMTPISASNGQYSFYRKLGSGTPQDTGSNATDFMFVSTTGAAYGRTGAAGDQVSGPSVLGAPGPENLSSQINRNNGIQASLIDPQCNGFGTPASACARVRTANGSNPTNAAYGTLLIRRKFTNTTGQTVSRVRFRVIDITTLGNTTAGEADLRVLNSTADTLTMTNASTVTLEALTLDSVPAQPNGGGLNSTLNLNTPLAAGGSVNVEFRLGVMTSGAYRFLVNVEALPQTTTGTSEPPTAQDFAVARLDPANRTGESGVDLRSGNYNWSLPLVSLPGRSGLDLGLGLVYNSRVWTKSGSSIMFDADHGTPSPGFRLGFPVIQPRYYNAQTQKNAYLLVTPSGAHVELRQTATPNVYESGDSSYLQLTENGIGLILRPTDGSQMMFTWQNGEYQCVEVKDRNGNYITIAYDSLGQLQTVRDTLAREINFVYDSNQNLNKITQVRNGVEHVWASFGWGQQTIQTNFAGLSVIGLANGSTIPVLTQVGLADGSLYRFDYTTWGQVNRISRYTLTSDTPPASPQFPNDYTIRAYTAYFLRFDNAADTDSPRVQARSDWAEYWNGGAEASTSYSYDPSGAWGQMITPDGTRNVEEFGTGWQKGLTLGTKIYEPGAQGTPVKTTSFTWTQDDENLQYEANPRVTATNIDDRDGNHRHTEIGYTSYGLPNEIREYSGTTVIRRTNTSYILESPYIDPVNNRRLIGLITEQVVRGVDLVDNNPVGAEKLYAKTTFDYDEGGEFIVDQGAATQHDAAYNANFNVRGNVTTIRKWDVSQTNVSVASRKGYNTNGSTILTRDPLWTSANNRQVSISYTDAFVDQSEQANSFNPFAPGSAGTFAYPTTITDAEGFKTFSKYDYHLGVARQAQTPPPNSITPTDYSGPVQTTSYDSLGRVTRVSNSVNAAQTVRSYPASLTTAITKMKIKADQVTEDQFTRSFQIFDGAGRVRASASDFDTAQQLYNGRKMVYDKMGRLVNQSNPTAMSANWVAASDDATTGWVYTAQEYDWNGRSTLSINADGSTREMKYGGCGCAGGAVVTTRDEMGRRRKTIADILGRVWKSQVLSSQPKSEVLSAGTDADVYKTTINTYNALDQMIEIKELVGVGGTAQITTMQYDGYGRKWKQHLPEQDEGTFTEYVYNENHMVQTVTDARLAKTTYSYNNRRQLTGISYDNSQAGTPDKPVAPTSAVTFGYDAAGNRKWMDDGPGRVDYQYDQLSRLQTETRQFDGVGSFPLSYGYNLGGQVENVTDWETKQINYSYDSTGKLASVTTPTPYADNISTYASNFQYRAWGALKSFTYGNRRTLSRTYDTRLQLTSSLIAGQTPQGVPEAMKAGYEYYSDGRISFVDDQLDDRFDRAYEYDLTARLSKGLTGPEARVFAGKPVGDETQGPYSQNYTYDVWGNLTGKTGDHWSQSQSFAATYVNNRRGGWIYDASGKEVSDDSRYGRHFIYDTAGRKTESREHQRRGGGQTTLFDTDLSLLQGYDGDGVRARREEQRVTRVNNGAPQTTIDVTYYVRSMALGGMVVAELKGQGQVDKKYVYANGQQVVKQWGGFLYWHQADPVTGSTKAEATQGYNYAEGAELDPLGNDVGTYDPYAVDELSDYGGSYQTAGNAFDNSGGGCVWPDLGVPAPCSVIAFAINSGYLQNPEGSRGFNQLGNSSSLYRFTNNFSDEISYWFRFDNAAEFEDSMDSWASPLWVTTMVDVGQGEDYEHLVEEGRFAHASGPAAADGEQLSQCLRDALRPFFPQQTAQGNTFSPVDDARFKSGIPTLLSFGTDVAVTLGLYDIHYNPANVKLSGGGSNDLFTIIEELSHTVQFLQVWAGMKQRRIISPSVSYSHAMVQWENHYLKHAAIGLKKNGNSYENDVEKWAKNNTIDIFNKLVGQTPSGNLCGFRLFPFYFSRPTYK